MHLIVYQLVLMSFLEGSDYLILSKQLLLSSSEIFYLLCEIDTPLYWASLVCEA